MSNALLKLHVPSRDVRRPAYSPKLCGCYLEQQFALVEHLRVALTDMLGTRNGLSADVMRSFCCLEDFQLQLLLLILLLRLRLGSIQEN